MIKLAAEIDRVTMPIRDVLGQTIGVMPVYVWRLAEPKNGVEYSPLSPDCAQWMQHVGCLERACKILLYADTDDAHFTRYEHLVKVHADPFTVDFYDTATVTVAQGRLVAMALNAHGAEDATKHTN